MCALMLENNLRRNLIGLKKMRKVYTWNRGEYARYHSTFFFGMGTLKIYYLSKFQVYNIELLSFIVMPHIEGQSH